MGSEGWLGSLEGGWGVLGLAGGSEGPGERSRVLSEGLVDLLRGLWGQLSGLGRRTENKETDRQMYGQMGRQMANLPILQDR